MAERNFENRTLFKGDNLDFLRGMNSETVDLIATDPPFNKDKDFHATPESLAAGARFQDRWRWNEDVQPEWVDEIKDDHPRVYELIDFVIGGLGRESRERRKVGGREDLAAFLCFMGVRLIEMRRILKDTGSLYLHCDPTASHYLKSLMDAIFGDRSFRNEIVWAYTGPGSPRMRQFNRKHDIIFWYAKGRSWTFNSDEVRLPYETSTVSRGRYDSASPTTGGGLRDVTRGKVPESWWRDIPSGGQISRKELVGYPTQKPLALYERIIKASSNPGDMVLDPFCGCATTPIAAERLGRQWVGMDLWDGAYEIVNRRMEDNKQLLANRDPQIILRDETDIPVRTDDGEDAPAFELRLEIQRPVERWQRLSHAEMRNILADAQASVTGLVDCAGCGRSLEPEFMELDHINPRAQGGENWITNRILLCGPCNRRKNADLTIIGLQRQNRRVGWMHNPQTADSALIRANKRAQEIARGG